MQQAVISSQISFDWSFIVGAVLAITVVGLAVVLCNKLKRLRAMQKLAHRRGVRLVELMRLMNMAEDSAGLGVWHYYSSVGRQEWSGGMKELFGLERNAELREGDAETLLASNEIDLVAHVMDRKIGHAVDSSQFTIRRCDGSRRTLQLQACHLHEGKGEADHVLGLLADVTNREVSNYGEANSNQAANFSMASIKPVHLVERHRLMGDIDRCVIKFRCHGTPASLLLIAVGGGTRERKAACEKLRNEIATVAHDYLRTSDTFCWLGGNEFAWLAAGADVHFAELAAERLQCIFGLAGLTGLFSDNGINIGVAYARDGDTALSLFARADGALDRSKRKSLMRVA